VELLAIRAILSQKGTDTTRSGTRSLASVLFWLRFFEVVEVSGRYLPVNGYETIFIIILIGVNFNPQSLA
jgi:hypothetical protein